MEWAKYEARGCPTLDAQRAAFPKVAGASKAHTSAMPTVTSCDGTAIAYERRGEGPAAILVDGTLGSRAVDFLSGLQSILSKDMTVYRYDRRGRNESGDTQPYAVQREIEDLDALIDEAGGRAFVYGVSSGAALALETAASLGRKIERLAMYEAPYWLEDAESYRAELDRLLAGGRTDEAIELFLSISTMPGRALDRLRRSPAWEAMRASAHTLAYDAKVVNDGVIPLDRAAALTVPTLIMSGESSPDFVRTTARRLAEIIPHATYRELAGQTHTVDPRVLGPVLSEFFGAERAPVG